MSLSRTPVWAVVDGTPIDSASSVVLSSSTPTSLSRTPIWAVVDGTPIPSSSEATSSSRAPIWAVVDGTPITTIPSTGVPIPSFTTKVPPTSVVPAASLNHESSSIFSGLSTSISEPIESSSPELLARAPVPSADPQKAKARSSTKKSTPKTTVRRPAQPKTTSRRTTTTRSTTTRTTTARATTTRTTTTTTSTTTTSTTTTSTTTTSTTTTSTTTTSTQSAAPSSGPYTFNPSSSSNVAVYWGASPLTTSAGLLSLCQDPSVDIIMLAFLGNYPGDNGFPSLKLGGRSCRAATSAQKRIAPGLVNCVGLAPAIEQCQRIGKPVLLSLGGSTSTSQFRSAPEAVQFASTLWSLFGGDFSNSTTLPLRPFGPNIALDGFDIDNENDNAGFYAEFARALRVKFATVPGRRFYLSGSPRCVLPSTSLSVDAMMQLDWVWPRFYAAAKCQITNTAGFLSAVQSWTQQLAGGPKLYLGLAASKLTVSGHAPGAEIADRVGQIDKAHAKSIGGIMLWDGSLAMVNDEKGTNYLKYAKQAVSRSFGSGN